MGNKRFFLLTAIISILLIGAGMARSETTQPRTAMYVFAHEDDEIDIAGKIVTDLRDGKNVYCVWMTKGDKGGDPVVREKESREVMKLLGVPQDRLVFLGFPDQAAFRHIGEIVIALSDVAARIKPTEIMTQAYEGGNIDHDTVSFVSSQVAKKFGLKLFDYPDNNVVNGVTYIWRFLPGSETPIQYTKLSKELYDLKFKVTHMYPSQQSGLNAYEFMVDKKDLRKNGEPYRVAPEYDYSKPPAAESRYASTSKGTANFETFLDAVKDYFAETEK
jgi:LmbE family N-acetylglucosaminyl deacetylase